MGFLKSKKGSEISDYFKLLVNIGNYEAGNMYDVALYEDHLAITHPVLKNKIILNYDQITDVFHGYQTALLEAKKSVIGRALVGGVLFGGAGAVVGALTGSNPKIKKEKHLYLIISYNTLENKDNFIQFEDTRQYKGAKLSKKLRELAKIPDKIIGDIQL